MMTVPMDNTSDLSSRDRAQRLYNKNVELENRRRRSAQSRVPSDPNAWQHMRENYEAIILEDHAFSEQHEIEYSLWQLHYKRIEELRSHFSAAFSSTATTSPPSQSGKSPVRPDRVTKIRSQFKTFLSEATGFYHDLMLKIRSKYGLPLGYFSDDSANSAALSKDGYKSTDLRKGLISCHRCLIYLGDLARYKGLYGEGDSKNREYTAASSYYLQASSLLPSNGNPHHQLAILASYSADELTTTYRYFRSLAVDNPFSTARDNLIIAFEKNRQSYSQLLGDAKASSAKKAPTRTPGKGRGKGETRLPSKDNKPQASSVKERSCSISETYKAFCIRFVRLNGILFTRTSLETFGEVFLATRSDFLDLLSSGLQEEFNFGSNAAENRHLIVKLIATLIFTVHNVSRETENQSYAEILQRSVLLQNAFTAIHQFTGHILERCIQLHDPSDSYLLPGVLVFVEWLACHPDIATGGSEVDEKQAASRTFFWKHCVLFLNKLLSSGSVSFNEDEDESCFLNMSRYEEDETANRLALWEDFELRGFLPLRPAHLILDFSRKHNNNDKRARIQRIVAAGKALASVVRVAQQGIYFDSKGKKFVISAEPPQVSDDVELPVSLECETLRQERFVEKKMNSTILQPRAEVGEEEEEEIVFKPSVNDKHVDTVVPELFFHEVVGPVSSASMSDSGGYAGSVVDPHDPIHLQNAYDTSSRQPIQPSTPNWLVKQQASMTEGLKNLSFMENGHTMKPEKQSHLGILQTAALSLPFPQSVNLSSVGMFPDHFSETVIPSKFDSVMSSGASDNSLFMKSLSPSSASLRKNPVSRPVRQLGPPPGFSQVPSKHVDEPVSGFNTKNENILVDDYSWLDGYKGTGVNDSVNHSAPTYRHGGNGVTETVRFPFPGKQVSSLQAQVGNQKSLQQYELPEHLTPYQDQLQQQLPRGNHQSNPLLGHYQGQPLWESRFFV